MAQTPLARPYGLVSGLVRSVRPKQWAKNVFVFAAVVFAGRLADPWSVAVSMAAFVIFCALSGAAYLINDVLDHQRDRLHPRKARRPIASGAVPRSVAVGAALLLAACGLAASPLLGLEFSLVSAGYFVLTLAYSTVFKHLVLIDVLAVALGYVARAAAGAFAIGVPVSEWLLLCTILLALFIALTKRRHELITLESAADHRGILEAYSGPLIDQLVSLVSSAILISYALYTFYGDHARSGVMLIFTLPFVLYGLFRYLWLTYRDDRGGSPEDLVFSDRPLLICILGWALTSAVILHWP